MGTQRKTLIRLSVTSQKLSPLIYNILIPANKIRLGASCLSQHAEQVDDIQVWRVRCDDAERELFCLNAVPDD